MAGNDWMANIPGGAFIKDITMPGSHDAGVYDVIEMKTSGVRASSVRCQSGDVAKQLQVGSRFIDCRVFLKKLHVAGRVENIPTMGHFAFDTKRGTLGGYGGSLFSAINQACNFVINNPTEFVILRISHTKCTDEVGKALLQYNLNFPMYASHIFVTDAMTNVSNLRLHQLRGKVIMAFDSKFNKQRFDPNTQFLTAKKRKIGGTKIKANTATGVENSLIPGNFVGMQQFGMTEFRKYKGGIMSAGVCTCGDYSKDMGHGTSKKMAMRYDQQIEAIENHQNHADDHLLYTYWQVTGGNVESNTVGVGSMRAQLVPFIADLADKYRSDPNNYRLPNVIAHDFVDNDSCANIVYLNQVRNLY
jgi:hypothetical protein